MRSRIIQALHARMREDEDLFFLTADMGINLVEPIQTSYPGRFLNVGIAEQNLVGVAAGLCNAGFRPFLYTISNFVTERCFEQIRNDVRIHDYPVTLLGTNTGFDNAPLGPTHHVVDDWGALHAIPGVDIYCPSTITYAESLVDRILRRRNTAYVRIPKGSFIEPASPDDAIYLPSKRQGGPLLVSYGSLVQNCLGVQETHDDVAVLVINKLRPLQEPVVLQALMRHQRVYVVEDHFPQNGLYALLCRFCLEHGLTPRITSLAPTDSYCLTVGGAASFYHQLYGLDKPGIEKAIAKP